MKKTVALALFVLLVTGIIACSPGGGFQTQSSTCSYGGEICVHIILPETFDPTNPVPFKISVTSNKDLPTLQISILSDKNLVFDTPKRLEDSITKNISTPGVVIWVFSIKAGETIIFDRSLHLPQQAGNYQIVAEAVSFNRVIDAKEDIGILITDNKGYVLRSGTPMPPFIAIITPEIYGPGTPVPTPWWAIATPTVKSPGETPSTTPSVTHIPQDTGGPSSGPTPYP